MDIVLTLVWTLATLAAGIIIGYYYGFGHADEYWRNHMNWVNAHHNREVEELKDRLGESQPRYDCRKKSKCKKKNK